MWCVNYRIRPGDPEQCWKQFDTKEEADQARLELLPIAFYFENGTELRRDVHEIFVQEEP